MSPQDTVRKRELGLIHMAKAFFAQRDGMTADDYRAVVLQVTGKTSSADLDSAGREKLLQHFKAKGFVVKAKPGAARAAPIREPQVKKLMAMWYALAEANAVARPASHEACSRALEAWAKEQLATHTLGPMDALRFATGEQLNHLVEAMKLWGRRVKANIY